jgi:hypothetical protein
MKPRLATKPHRNRESETQRDGESETQRLRGYGESDETDDTQEAASPTLRFGNIGEAVQASLADTSFGDPVFKFARAIRAFEKTTGIVLPANELGGTFSKWWATAKPSLPANADFDEYKMMFLSSLQKVKTPLGTNVLETALSRMKTTPLPAESTRFTSPKLQRLVHLCHELQSLAGDAPFFLGVRDAARVIDCARFETASAFLAGLVAEGILRVEHKGVPGGRRATRYRYCSSNPTPIL